MNCFLSYRKMDSTLCATLEGVLYNISVKEIVILFNEVMIWGAKYGDFKAWKQNARQPQKMLLKQYGELSALCGLYAQRKNSVGQQATEGLRIRQCYKLQTNLWNGQDKSIQSLDIFGDLYCKLKHMTCYKQDHIYWARRHQVWLCHR